MFLPRNPPQKSRHQTTCRKHQQYNEAREARSAKPFFLGFPRKKKSLFITGHARRVGCLFLFSLSVCVCVCIIQRRNRPLRSTALNAHGTNASPDGLCARTHTNEAFSCWFCCKSFRVDRARRGNVFLEAWLGRVSNFKCLERTYQVPIYHHVFFLVLEKILPNEASANSRPTECVPCGP